MIRLRIQVADWPRRSVVLTGTPLSDCSNCEGLGGIEHDYGDYETGEYAGTDWEPCPCWNESRRWTLLPLPRRPRWLRRRDHGRDPWGPGGDSDEPPF
ncbi:hypothetical protein LRS74_15300 [Streptomyces sp. LX-29]|uniref:hypothetical protein n=1 Tax=Streptomyces sp. LX-29 TaxID=2900152 RepID=UPI00240CED76|nr:hypothetical protein [Streptomyces sp. LX-29]WFB08267.1 hypothetical protein LRS74_15300 [Streptomyces sp. LX-29]